MATSNVNVSEKQVHQTPASATMESSSPAASRKPKELPFYAAPEHVQMSADIIREAKRSLDRSGMKTINMTMRPYTPQEGSRKLFGETRDSRSRPPSAFSLGSHHFESESRPSSSKVRLDPIDHKPRTPQHEGPEGGIVAPRPPADPNRPLRRSSSRQKLQHSISVDTSPPNSSLPHGRSGSLQDVSDVSSRPSSGSVPTTPESQRRVRSGPQQRSRPDSMGDPRDDSRDAVSHRSSSRNGQGRSRHSDPLENGNISDQHNRGGSGGSGGHSRDSSQSRREGSGGRRRTGSSEKRSSDPVVISHAHHKERGSSGSLGKREGHKESRSNSHSEGAGAPETRSSSHREREGSVGSRTDVNTQRVSSAGRQGSAGRREEETPEEATYYKTYVAPIMDDIVKHCKDKDSSDLSTLTQKSDQLYDTLQEGNMLGKNCRHRPLILKVIFKTLDMASPQLLLKQGRLILALRVSGKNLLNVCKLMFKVGQDKKNDSYFLEANLLDLLIDVVRTTDHTVAPGSEALVYCLGTMKFLSSNPTIVKHLVKKGCIEATAKLLASLSKTISEVGKPIEQTSNILVQLTGVLRNCAEVSGTRSQFLEHNVIEELCKMMEVFLHEGDLILNISRLFSKLTTHIDCCKAVGSRSSNFKAFLHALNKYMKNADLVVRISYILGNLTAKSESSRKRLFSQNKAFETLIAVFKHYSNELDLKKKGGRDASPGKGDSKEGTVSRMEDILIKIVRVIANLSINEDIGPVIANSQTCVVLLIRVLETHDLQHNEELVLNTIATINNLSYYTANPSAIASRQLDIVKVLLNFLDVNHMEGLAETTRVLGNLSREKPVREFLFSKRVTEMMIAMLDSGDRETVFTACGVLINLMGDQDKRRVLKKQSGVTKLIEVLRDFARSDWQLASMVCQTLWNYSGKITSSNACFGENEAAELGELLIEYLDEDAALDPSLSVDLDEEMREYTQQIWESEFCPVANQLLNRIESHQSEFEPLEHPS